MFGHDHEPRRAFPPEPPRRLAGRPFATAVWLGATSALLVFAILTLASAWWKSHRAPERPGTPPALPPAEVDLWVGDLAPGVVGVLSAEWNDPAVDARYDARLNAELGTGPEGALAFYRLQVFNTTAAPVSVPLPGGAVVVTPKDGAPLPMVSLAPLLAGGVGREAPASPAATTLRRLGADRETVELPASARDSHPVALSRRVPLGAVESVSRADGTPFHRRRMSQRQWSGLVGSPSLADLRDL